MICCTPGEYIYEHPVSDDHWKKDEILAAKIKKFLSVSLWCRNAVLILLLFIAERFECATKFCFNNYESLFTGVPVYLATGISVPIWVVFINIETIGFVLFFSL